MPSKCSQDGMKILSIKKFATNAIDDLERIENSLNNAYYWNTRSGSTADAFVFSSLEMAEQELLSVKTWIDRLQENLTEEILLRDAE